MVRRLAVAAVLSALALPAVAFAAAPSASTGGAKNVSQTAALLTGSVNPNGEATTYHFEFGTTKAYGTQTPSQGPTAAVKASQAVSAAIAGLTPGTSYHYRLVAQNASGTKLGRDKTFKTPQPAAAVTLAATRRRVTFGASTVLSGQFTPSPGKTAVGVRITLEQDVAPFTPPAFKSVATARTDANGRFTFTQAPGTNTTYRVVAATNPKATSAAVPVGVASRVTTSLSTAHPKRGKRVVFSGLVMPARTGGLVRVQKRVGKRWRTVKTGALRAGPTATENAYRVAVRVRRKGTYRVYVPADTANLAGASRARTITPR